CSALVPTLPPSTSAIFPYTTLFRSRANDTASDSSDYDLVLIIDDCNLSPIERSQRAHTILWDAGIHLSTDLFIFTPDEFDKERLDRKSTRLNSSHVKRSYAVFCLKK